MMAVGEKNFLHAASEVGARAAAVMYSLVKSCLLVDGMQWVSEKVPVAELLARNWKFRVPDDARSKHQPPQFSAAA